MLFYEIIVSGGWESLNGVFVRTGPFIEYKFIHPKKLNEEGWMNGMQKFRF